MSLTNKLTLGSVLTVIVVVLVAILRFPPPADKLPDVLYVPPEVLASNPMIAQQKKLIDALQQMAEGLEVVAHE